jgi:hypothetical protein
MTAAASGRCKNESDRTLVHSRWHEHPNLRAVRVRIHDWLEAHPETCHCALCEQDGNELHHEMAGFLWALSSGICTI